MREIALVSLAFIYVILLYILCCLTFEQLTDPDLLLLLSRLKEHVEDSTKLPILIFPEGTCINNSAVMQFKKGSFEVGGVIYPVAIKVSTMYLATIFLLYGIAFLKYGMLIFLCLQYDSRFGDPFWNSHDYSMLQYLYMMMTSWAIVCDVWYLPPMTRKPGESGVDFANRVSQSLTFLMQ